MYPVTKETDLGLLRSNYVYLLETLDVDNVVGYLFQECVISKQQLEEIQGKTTRREKCKHLLDVLLRKIEADYIEQFLCALDNQQNVRDHLRQAKNTDGKRVVYDRNMDATSDKFKAMDEGSVGDDRDTDEGQNCGFKLRQIIDFKENPEEQNVTLHVKVMTIEKVEEKSNQKQFMAVVADATSAVDICVRNDKLFDKFLPETCIILRNVIWNGKVLFTKNDSTATFAPTMQVPDNITAIAFGGELVQISEVCTLPDMRWFTLRGKIVQQSPLIKRKLFGKKVLLYRQVKLKDNTGSVYMDVWAELAEHMQLGRVVQVDSCKKRQLQSSDVPPVTTTVKSSVKCLSSTGFEHIRNDEDEEGNLFGIDVTLYMSCPNPKCFHFQLTGMKCESCLREISVLDQVSYVKATVNISTPEGNMDSLTVYWPELCQLFQLFEKEKPEIDKGKIIKAFLDLGNRTVKYKACGIVSTFKL